MFPHAYIVWSPLGFLEFMLVVAAVIAICIGIFKLRRAIDRLFEK